MPFCTSTTFVVGRHQRARPRRPAPPRPPRLQRVERQAGRRHRRRRRSRSPKQCTFVISTQYLRRGPRARSPESILGSDGAANTSRSLPACAPRRPAGRRDRDLPPRPHLRRQTPPAHAGCRREGASAEACVADSAAGSRPREPRGRRRPTFSTSGSSVARCAPRAARAGRRLLLPAAVAVNRDLGAARAGQSIQSISSTRKLALIRNNPGESPRMPSRDRISRRRRWYGGHPSSLRPGRLRHAGDHLPARR